MRDVAKTSWKLGHLFSGRAYCDLPQKLLPPKITCHTVFCVIDIIICSVFDACRLSPTYQFLINIHASMNAYSVQSWFHYSLRTIINLNRAVCSTIEIQVLDKSFLGSMHVA
jgi:hypothetical protein